MITFNQFLSEIAVNSSAKDFFQNTKIPRSSSRIVPDENKFNIIPVRLSYATYKVFKQHITPRYELANKLLDRRGDGVDWVVVRASNQEIQNLRDLADDIIRTSSGDGEIRTAYATIKALQDSMSVSSTKD